MSTIVNNDNTAPTANAAVASEAAHRTADALDASANTAELWRAHAAQIRSLGESVALSCENLAAEIDERAKLFSQTVESFADYVAQTEARIAAEHQRLMSVNVAEPVSKGIYMRDRGEGAKPNGDWSTLAAGELSPRGGVAGPPA